MTLLYAAQCSMVLLRPKHDLKLSTQVQTSGCVWGHGPCRVERNVFATCSWSPADRSFFSPTRTVPWFREHYTPVQHDQGGGGEKISNARMQRSHVRRCSAVSGPPAKHSKRHHSLHIGSERLLFGRQTALSPLPVNGICHIRHQK